MLPGQRDFLVRQEQYQDLLREAEKERLIQAAELGRAGKWGRPRQTAYWLGTYVVKWGLKLQANRPTAPTCCGDCCRVELKVNASI
ncbi:MAG TPA: hypothetical protein VEC93_09720 [Anaerolineae bacterium]|nr:hypothetical protein [Anaerolineae bacterium]